MDFLDALDEPVAHEAEIVPVKRELVRQKSPDEQRIDLVRELEEEIYLENVQIVRDAARFVELRPDATEPPPEWIAKMGPEAAWRRFHAAMGAWMGAKSAPVGLSLAKSIVLGVQRNRAMEKSAPKTLNMMMVQISAPLPVFEEEEIEEK